MNPLLIFLTNSYWLLLPQWLAENLWYADWQRARKRGVLGLAWEAVKCVVSLNVYAIAVSAQAGWSPRDVSQYLAQYGIATWGWVYDTEWVTFHVRPRQARYAQRMLHRANLPYC